MTIVLSCNSKQGKEKVIDKSAKTEASKPDSSFIDNQKEATSNTEILETFVDSLNIGEKENAR